MNEYDVVVIGGGAAGLSAALVLTRARRQVAVVDAGQPRNAPAAHMQGFLGSDGLPPTELLARGRDEVTWYGGHLTTGTVASIKPDAATAAASRIGFEVSLGDGTSLRARRVLVSTGLRDDIPDLPGVRERWGRDLLHCPYCHGYEVRDQPLGVLGATPEAVTHAHIIRQWSDDVVLFANGDTLTTDQREQLDARAIGIVDTAVSGLVIEDDRLTGVELVTGQVVARTAVFVRPRLVPNDTLLTGLGCSTHDNGWVVADLTGRTSVPGVYAAGNAVNPRAQVITAAGEGSSAAIAINNDLVDEDIRIAVTNFRLGLPGRADPSPGNRDRRHPLPHPRTPPQHARSIAMSNAPQAALPLGPPSKHQLALRIWIAVFPTLTVLNLTIGPWLSGSDPVLRTFVLATIAVPIVIYGLMPRLHRIRARILTRRAA